MLVSGRKKRSVDVQFFSQRLASFGQELGVTSILFALVTWVQSIRIGRPISCKTEDSFHLTSIEARMGVLQTCLTATINVLMLIPPKWMFVTQLYNLVGL